MPRLHHGAARAIVGSRTPMSPEACRFWIGSDATGRRCNAGVEKVGLCAKHYPIERRRIEQQIEKGKARAERSEAAWLARNLRNLPAWRVQLEQAEAEYQRRTAPAVADRAAVGGAMHSSIVRAQRSHLSDTNVTRVIELERIIQRLRADIARAEKAAA